MRELIHCEVEEWFEKIKLLFGGGSNDEFPLIPEEGAPSLR